VLIIASKPHRDSLVRALGEGGLDVQKHARQGQFTMFDAEEILATFMRKGMPKRELFMDSIGGLLNDAKSSSKPKHMGLTVFGEMVALLWEEGRREAAIQLEKLWNETLGQSAFHLHCAYPRAAFGKDIDDHLLIEVCHAHTHVMTA